MASNGNDTLDFVLVFGQKKLPIHLDLSATRDPASCLTVGHLSDAVFKETNVEPSRQKLIYKGKALANSETTLSSLKIRNGDRVMLLVRKGIEKKAAASSSETMGSGLMDKLEELQVKVKDLCIRFDQQVGDSKATMELSGLRSSKKSLLQLHEDSMKLLEKIDSTPAQDNDHFRRERKVLVNTLQSTLDKCEKRIDDMSQQIKGLENEADGSGS